MLEETITVKDNEIARLLADITAKDGMVSDGEKVIAERDGVIAGLHKQMDGLALTNTKNSELILELRVKNSANNRMVEFIIKAARYTEHHDQVYRLKRLTYDDITDKWTDVYYVHRYIQHFTNFITISDDRNKLEKVKLALKQHMIYLKEMRSSDNDKRISYTDWITNMKKDTSIVTHETIYEMIYEYEKIYQ